MGIDELDQQGEAVTEPLKHTPTHKPLSVEVNELI